MGTEGAGLCLLHFPGLRRFWEVDKNGKMIKGKIITPKDQADEMFG